MSSSEDQTVRFWEISKGHCLRTLVGYSNRVRAISFSPDGNFLASGREDGIIKLWDLQPDECTRILRSDRPYERMNISGAMGLTAAQKVTLKALGAIEKGEK